jgi:hypothetical protein
MSRYWLVFGLLLYSSLSWGNFYASPNRLMLAPTQNFQTLYIMNDSNKERVFVLSLRDYKMDQKGDLVLLPEAETFEFSAKDKIQFLPRALRLKPNERGAVKIVRTRKDIRSGSYHVHLNIQRKNIVNLDYTEKSQKKSGYVVGIEYDVSIPIFVNYGKPNNQDIAITTKFIQEDALNYQMNIQIDNNTLFLDRLSFFLLEKNSKLEDDKVWTLEVAAYPEAKSFSFSKPIPKSSISGKSVLWLMVKNSKDKLVKYEKIQIN